MSSPVIKHEHAAMRDLHWSPAEKSIARKAFETALGREFVAVIAETKKMASKIEQPDDLWELERYLGERRKEIDRTYDYRYSVLPEVFGELIRQGRLSPEELRGLGEDKLLYVRRTAAL